ncbi:glycerophosphodiester phosphodiesterase [Roseivirga pacifica]|uniref:glycerophosphodiester phosphodiesterase n=1 Tax=Roseivirga pacifica TaxID=1267423 RepID=UPI0020953E4B|nr:glycerophosphodiester phosphodiesterase family protein [Roseivirga pacifica]MCO6360787.1 glycerophosphodiester phosphodiesterase [Roseivirga pacifica]MCO6368676.1 glycerophosphodiester phosphodiesterase [Roseivirga pacifica]MCO6372819.1 glycerophosphodiester phosphodiesterase [Roseivirga pacifica]MCO6376878.1 glycerophosphodiester phosphodiesterase [Roseivirga pacifica]MCO6377844.1 glycerophosphodiester phosphodiesterase [Roseivirga pacifica]
MQRTFILLISFAIYSTAMAQTKVIAHRGFSGIAPENTLSAFQKAIDHKIEFFELDVHITKDDSVVVIHDSSVDRTSSNGKTGKIADMTYAEVRQVKAGYTDKFDDDFKNESIPTLHEALALAKDKIKVCVEIKAFGTEEQVMRTINKLGMKDQVIIFSFHYPVLAKIRKMDESIPILYLKGSADEFTLDHAKVIDARYIGVGGGTKLTREFLAKAHAQGIKVWRYTVDDEPTMKELLELGIDGIISNHPDRVERLLK